VSTNIPNTDSIDATFYNYEVLPGIREIPISQFNSSPTDLFYDANDIKNTKNLAQQILQNKTISPLIIVVDNEATPYILEGAHRLGALHLLGIQTFPALVVLDYDSEEK
jgi:disulfide oxidoreductase YuzD